MTQPPDDLLAALEAAERSAPDPSTQTADRVWAAVESRLADGPPPPPLDDAPLFEPSSGPVGLKLLKIAGGLAVLGVIAAGASTLWSRPGPPAAGPSSTAGDAVGPATPPGAPEPPPGAPEPPPGAPEPPPGAPEPPPGAPVPPPGPGPAATVMPSSDTAEKTHATGPEPRPRLKIKPAKPSPSRPAAPEPRTLADELALMKSITASLKSHDAAKTLRLVREHERDFPSGQFIEERRAAKARALCRRGKTASGRKEAERFAKRWPGSIHLSAVREDCGPR